LAWIKTIDEGKAKEEGGHLARLYASVASPPARVDNVLAVHSLNPTGLEAHLGLYRAAMRPTEGLGAAEREMIAVVVSAANGCHY